MLGHRMSGWSRARVQLCGRFAVQIDGDRVEDRLPGRRGRLLFAYLVVHRGRPVPRDELLMAGWGAEAPAAAGNALSVTLSKLRHGLGADHLQGRTGVELLLPPATFVDVEAALEGAHRAETAIAEGRWAEAWGPAGIAYHVAPGGSWSGWRRPGPTSGAAGWKRCGSAGWSASPPPASASAAPPWPRPRSGPGP
jgi:hypothetical protein